MQILIEIPNPPKKQEIVDIPIHFIDGDVCEAGGYGFKVLPPHGRLIDRDKIVKEYYINPTYLNLCTIINNTPTILEAEN